MVQMHGKGKSRRAAAEHVEVAQGAVEEGAPQEDHMRSPPCNAGDDIDAHEDRDAKRRRLQVPIPQRAPGVHWGDVPVQMPRNWEVVPALPSFAAPAEQIPLQPTRSADAAASRDCSAGSGDGAVAACTGGLAGHSGNNLSEGNADEMSEEPEPVTPAHMRHSFLEHQAMAIMEEPTSEYEMDLELYP